MKYLWSAFLTGGLFVMGAVDLALTRKPAVYPAKGQSAQQEAKDDTACYDWARQNTGRLSRRRSGRSTARTGAWWTASYRGGWRRPQRVPWAGLLRLQRRERSSSRRVSS